VFVLRRIGLEARGRDSSLAAIQVARTLDLAVFLFCSQGLVWYSVGNGKARLACDTIPLTRSHVGGKAIGESHDSGKR
jgi:hypothetical protein